MPLHIECEEHFKHVMDFAKQHACEEALISKLRRLQEYGDGTTTFLHQDFAPLSFAFLVQDAAGRRVLVGGLIYSGPNQRLDGSAPAYSVSVDPPTNEHRWSIHT